MPGRSFPRRPYLSWVEDPATTMTIRYGTVHKDADVVLYGEQSKLSKQIKSNFGNEKQITLKNLKPGTLYRYQIGYKGAAYSFYTAPRGDAPYHFIVYGDYSSGGQSSIKLRLYRAILRERPAFLLFTGDLVTNGNYPFYWANEFFAPAGILSPYYPLMIAPGNHDGQSLFQYYFSYPGGKRWYSFVYANVLFIAIDTESNFAPGSSQYQFIEKTLQNAKTAWKLVYLHKPPYSTNAGHHSDLRVRALLCPIFEKYGVDMVFSGHNHCYERTRPIRQNRVDMKTGVTYITTGGGGAELIPFLPWNKLSAVEKSWSLVRISKHHYVVVRKSGHNLNIAVKGPDAKIIDSFVLSRR